MRTIKGFGHRVDSVMERAQEVARRYNHEFIGTEHILLALLEEEYGGALKIWQRLKTDLLFIRLQLEAEMKQDAGDFVVLRRCMTPRAKDALQHAFEEAGSRLTGSALVETEDLLLGLLRVQGGLAVKILNGSGLTVETVRPETIKT